MGCAADWDPACDAAQLTLDPADGLWRLTADIPAGSWEYKVAINRAWDENYGAGGVAAGPNIALSLAADSPVTFTYDPTTHVVTTDVGPGGRPLPQHHPPRSRSPAASTARSGARPTGTRRATGRR